MSKGKVLIVEDEKQFRNNLKEFVLLEGYEVITASNGKEAIEKFKDSENIVVVTDLNMPEVGGIELLKIIKEKHPSTQVIIVSASSNFNDPESALKLQAFDYFVKPLKDINEIIASINRAFNESQIVKREIEAKLKTQKEMLSFLSHTIGNTIASAPLVIRDISETLKELFKDNIKDKKAQSLFNELGELDATFIAIQKMLDIYRIYAKDPEQANVQWIADKEITEGVPFIFLIALAIKQVLSRILFEYQHVKKRKLFFKKTEISEVRLAYTNELVLQDLSENNFEFIYDWVTNHLSIVDFKFNFTNFVINQNGIRFNLLFACVCEIMYNSFKYTNNERPINITVEETEIGFEFICSNSFDKDSTREKGTSKGLFFIEEILSSLDGVEFLHYIKENQFHVKIKINT